MKKRIFAMVIAALLLLGALPVTALADTAEKIPEGYYILTSALGNFSLDVSGAGTANGTNVHIYGTNNTKAQIFHIKPYTVNGTVQYELLPSYAENMAVDVKGAKRANGVNVQIYKSNHTAAQRWTITKDSTGYVTVRSALGSGFVLDVKGGARKNKANVQLYQSNNSAAQKWKLVRVAGTPSGSSSGASGTSSPGGSAGGSSGGNTSESSTGGSSPVGTKASYTNGGTYILVSKLNKSMAVDIPGGSQNVKTQIQLYKKNNSHAQIFRLQDTSDGYTLIRSMSSGLYLNVAGNKAANKTAVWMYKNDNSRAVKWSIEDTGDGDGSVYIRFANTAQVLDVPGAKAQNNQLLHTYKQNNTNAQKWFLIPASNKTGWQYYYGKYVYLTDTNGNYAVNTTVDGQKVGADGQMESGWVVSGGYYRYRMANGKFADDVRPYLFELFGSTTVNGQKAPRAPGYYATVDRQRCRVTIYTKYPGTNSWNLPVFSFLCTPGADVSPSPAGIHTTSQKARWHQLNGPTFGQYCTRITWSGVWFHSVPCHEMNDHNVEWGKYNQLGRRGSQGCVRVNVRNAYWLYTFCQTGMNVRIGDNLPYPVTAVPQPRMAEGTVVDPTDPAYTGNYGYTDSGKYYHYWYLVH